MTTVSQFTTAYSASGGSVSTPAKSCTAGSTVVVFFRSNEWSAPPTPTCTVGGVSATLVQSAGATDTPYARAWVLENIAGGSTVVTVSGYGSTRSGHVLAVELVGAATASALDVSSSIYSLGSSLQQFFSAASGGVTIAADATVLGCQFILLDPGALTPSSGYTALTGSNSETYASLIYKSFPTGASAERALNQGAVNDREYYGLLVSIKAAVAAPVITGPSGKQMTGGFFDLSGGTN